MELSEQTARSKIRIDFNSNMFKRVQSRQYFIWRFFILVKYLIQKKSRFYPDGNVLKKLSRDFLEKRTQTSDV